MSSTPIKNGIIVHLPEYGNKYVRADIYKISDTYVFVGTVFYEDQVHSGGADVEVFLEGNTMERTSQGYALLIVPRYNCRFIDESIMDHP